MLRRLQDTDELRIDEVTAGQHVVVAARWLLIVAGLGITLWSPAQADLGKIRVSVFVLLALAAGNFYLHAQTLLGRPLARSLALGASVADIAVITTIVAAYGGLNAAMYVFYFPALIALALAFPAADAAVFTLATVASYAAVCAGDLHHAAAAQALAQRLIAMCAVAVVSNVFFSVEQSTRPSLRGGIFGLARIRGGA